MTDARERWNQLTSGQRRAVFAVGLATTWWQVSMLWDLWRRPEDEIRGPKPAWVLGSFVRPVGQIAYYWWGRRPDREER